MDEFSKILDDMMFKLFIESGHVLKKPRDYGCGVLLYPSDIHMIEAIGNHKGANTTEISQIMGVTMGTVSKMIKKLEIKGFIKKYQFADNKKEVYFELTELGQEAFNGHNEFHKSKISDISKEFNGYSAEEKEFILKFIQKYTKELKKYLD